MSLIGTSPVNHWVGGSSPSRGALGKQNPAFSRVFS